MKAFVRNKFVWLIGAAFVAGVAWSWLSAGGPAASGKRLGRVRRGDIVQRVTVSGQIRPLRRTSFVAPYAGYIDKIYVKVGQMVKANDPIVSIKSSLQSPEPVFPLRAPFAGLVVDVSKMEGEYVNATDTKDPIVRVDDDRKFFVLASAPELDASRIKKDMDVEVRVSALDSTGGPLKGIVRDINMAAQDADGWKSQQSTFNVRVEILNPPSGLRAGQSAILDIVTDKVPNVLYLNHEFINQEGDKYFVITASGRRVPIQIGRQSDLAVEIKSGLKEGEQVQQIDFLKALESGT